MGNAQKGLGFSAVPTQDLEWAETTTCLCSQGSQALQRAEDDCPGLALPWLTVALSSTPTAPASNHTAGSYGKEGP